MVSLSQQLKANIANAEDVIQILLRVQFLELSCVNFRNSWFAEEARYCCEICLLFTKTNTRLEKKNTNNLKLLHKAKVHFT